MSPRPEIPPLSLARSDEHLPVISAGSRDDLPLRERLGDGEQVGGGWTSVPWVARRVCSPSHNLSLIGTMPPTCHRVKRAHDAIRKKRPDCQG